MSRVNSVNRLVGWALAGALGVGGAVCLEIAGAAMPCREQTGDTSPDYRCEKADVDCPQKTKQVTVGFGITGGVVAVSANSSITYPFDVPDGCDPAKQPWVDEQWCLKSTGVQFTAFPGGIKELRKQDCPTYTSKPCRERAFQTIVTPQAFSDWCYMQFGIRPPAGFNVPLPAKACEQDPAAMTSNFMCPGTGQTWYEIIDETCYP